MDNGFPNADLLNGDSSLSFEERNSDFTTHNFDDYMLKNSDLKNLNDDDDNMNSDGFVQLNILGQSFMTLNDNHHHHNNHIPNNLTSVNTTSFLFNHEILNKVNCVSFVLMAPTSPAVKVTEPSLTYLNQEQNYELRLIYNDLYNKTSCTPSDVCRDLFQKGKQFFDTKNMMKNDIKTNSEDKHKNNATFLSLLRLCFWDHKLQEKERDKIKQWEREYQKKILEVDQSNTSDMDIRTCNLYTSALEIIWTVESGSYKSINLKFNCTSTAFAKNKHGGEKGVHLRLQIDTYEIKNKDLMKLSNNLTNDMQQNFRQRHDLNQKNLKFLCSSYCRLQLFRLKGAQRKLKLDIQKIDKSKLSEDIRRKYQTSDLVTHLHNISFDQSYSLIPFQSQQITEITSGFTHNSLCNTDSLYMPHIPYCSNNYCDDDSTPQLGASEQLNGQSRGNNMVNTFSFGSKENYSNKYDVKDMMIDDLCTTSGSLSNQYNQSKSSRRSSITSNQTLLGLSKPYTNMPSDHLSLKSEMKIPMHLQSSVAEVASSHDCLPVHLNGVVLKCSSDSPISNALSKTKDTDNLILPNDESSEYFQQWLISKRFNTIMHKLQNFTTNDFLRLSKDDLIIITGDTAEAIRCFNSAHNVQIIPKLTIYLKFSDSDYFCAIYFDILTPKEFITKINESYITYKTENSYAGIEDNIMQYEDSSSSTNAKKSYLSGHEYNVFLKQNNILIKISDDVLKNLKKDSKYAISLEKFDRNSSDNNDSRIFNSSKMGFRIILNLIE